ncbi:hypothetical protein ACFZAC_26190 [Pseudomonas fluorescens]|uniref:hypothetical protein n=1 Tax=Pseudomonas fluorescens TaxID=294 RepID=UPI00374A6AE8
MQTNSKAIAQMTVQVIALKQILVAGKMTPEGAEFTMPLDEYGLASGDNIELAPGEDERIKAAIRDAQGKRPTRAEREAEEAERKAQNRAAIQEITAASAARAAEAARRRNALESLVDMALGKAGR